MLVKDSNEVPMLSSNKAMDKAQEIANKILRTTPHLARRILHLLIKPNNPLELPNDSIFKSPNQNTSAINTNPVQMPAIKNTGKDAKKKGSTTCNKSE